MNRYKNGKIFSLFLMCGILGACDKFEAIPLEYKSTPLEEAQEEVLNTIDPAWELELMETNGYVMAFKDKKYDKLFTRTLGWNGGDGVLTTLLPDGNAFWSFNDSFYGVVEGETRARKDCSFPRNSIMVQTPGDEEENLVWLADFVQTTTPEAPRYYIAGDVLKVIDSIEEKPDYIVLDPPRDGINPKALEKIILSNSATPSPNETTGNAV